MKWDGDPSEETFRSWGLPVPKRELPFHRTRKWRWDYAWPVGQGGVALEFQGGTWRKGGGAHRGVGFVRDVEKLNEGQILGWIVIQQLSHKKWTAETIAWIHRALEQKRG